MTTTKKKKSVRGRRKTTGEGVPVAPDVTFHGATLRLTSSSAPPSKHHYVRTSGPVGHRLYVTNLALRELAPLLLQDSVSEAVVASRKQKSPSTHRFSAGRSKTFTVRVNPQNHDIHVQMSKET